MAKCLFCGKEHAEHDKLIKNHLVITKDFDNGDIFVHGDLDNKRSMREMIEAAKLEIGIQDSSEENEVQYKEIVFHNRQRIGDMLMFTCAIRDFKKAYPDVRVNVISTAGHIWDHNPYIDRSLIATPDNTIKIGPSRLTNSSNRIDWHFTNAYRISIEDALHIHIPQGESRGDIWLTEEEYAAPRVFKDPYWLILLNGELGWGCKMYPFERWQEFINQNPDTQFVQLGTKEDNPPRLQGKNVIDYVGQTQSKENGIRDLFKLFLNAEGSISLVSFAMHLSGALYKPAIVIAGAREPASFTQYPGHRYLSSDGALPCADVKACWHCDIKACTNPPGEDPHKVPKCVELIYPEDLTRALKMFYDGGRLQKGIPSVKPKLKNIVKTPEKIVIPEVEKVELPEKYGMVWGGGCITDRDWEFMRGVIEKYKIKDVLEFGCGLSTLLMNDMGLKVISFETNQAWIEKIRAINPACDLRWWDGVTMPSDAVVHYHELAFVDGPANGRTREFSTRYGTDLADIVIVHDAGREFERQWQDKYCKQLFQGPIKGGHRCHLWLRKSAKTLKEKAILPTQDESREAISAPVRSQDGQFIKVVSTARGWGGCARSITTIMRMLLAAGHKVEFIPFRNAVGSSEFRDILQNELKDVILTENYDTLREHCDTLFMYADDYIWEFAQPGIVEAFSEINAGRKIMMVNYRRGKVGEIPWTKGWDKYMFLNSTQERDLLKVLPGVKTRVLPPCTDLAQFFKIQPDYNTNLRLVRHSSQGDVKFAKDFDVLVAKILESRPDAEISMIPGPSFIPSSDRFKKIPRTAEAGEIAQFLGTGNLFWYSLPAGYMDMGPRVILEAMAAGLPILADNWGGAIDRVTPETGWLCDTKEEMIKVISSVTVDELEKKGRAARIRALEEFVPDNWIKEIIG